MSDHDQWLVAVTAGTWQTHGIIEAKKLGLKVVAIDTDPNAMGFDHADHVLNVKLNDHDLVIRTLEELAFDIVGAVSFCSEAGMMLTAMVRDHFNLPGGGVALCRKLLDKGFQRKIWTEAGVPGPDWAVCEQESEAILQKDQWQYPFIIKPTDSSGSRGVTKIESDADDYKEAINRAFRFSRSGRIIIEGFMPGTEYTVETFSSGGDTHVLAVTEKKKVEGTRGTVAYELATSTLPSAKNREIGDIVSNALASLGYTNGPGHSEVIVMPDGEVGVVEVAGRGGGFMVFDKFVPAVSGVNLARITTQEVAGLPIDPIIIESMAGVLRFFPSQPGEIMGYEGFEEANALEGVEAGPFVKPGDKFNRAFTDGDRLGYMLTRAGTPQEAQRLTDKAEDLISFKIRSYEGN